MRNKICTFGRQNYSAALVEQYNMLLYYIHLSVVAAGAK